MMKIYAKHVAFDENAAANFQNSKLANGSRSSSIDPDVK